MKKYKVEFSGYAYIEAESKQDAEKNFDPAEAVLLEYGVDAVQEVNEFILKVES